MFFPFESCKLPGLFGSSVITSNTVSRKIVKDWCAAAHRVTKSWTRLRLEQPPPPPPRASKGIAQVVLYWAFVVVFVNLFQYLGIFFCFFIIVFVL